MENYIINEALVRRLIADQFPMWTDLPIRPMQPMGHDNRTFLLGQSLTVRLPSNASYVSHIPCEILCLQNLQPYLDVRIPECVGVGRPNAEFPSQWTVNRYIPGETITHEALPGDKEIRFAQDLRRALTQLHSAPRMDGPLAGKHCWYRGCHPSVYESEALAAMERWKNVLPVDVLRVIWDEAMKTEYTDAPVWFHGDVAVGNLLMQDGRLYAMIDFGTSGVGDPACDYVMAWTFFSPEARKDFLSGLDDGMILRAKAWAMWKALICFDGFADSIHAETLRKILSE